MTTSVIYTFGYGNRPTADSLLGFLGEYEIPYLIDVRLRAKAWTRRWWGDSVKQVVEGVGVSYLPRPDLGNTSGTAKWIPPDTSKAVLSLMEIRELLLEKGSVMLMCAELDNQKCHRTAIAQKLQEMVWEKSINFDYCTKLDALKSPEKYSPATVIRHLR